MTPSARSRQALKDAGYYVGTAEHWNPHARIRQDLGNFMDLLAWNGATILAIQATSGSNLASRRTKVLGLPQARLWLESGGRIQLHGWAKQGPAGKPKRWTLRAQELTLSDFPKEAP